MAEAWAGRCKPPLERAEWEPHVLGLIAKEEAKVEARGDDMTPPPLVPRITITEERGDSLLPEGRKVSIPEAEGEILSYRTASPTCEPPEAEPRFRAARAAMSSGFLM